MRLFGKISRKAANTVMFIFLALCVAACQPNKPDTAETPESKKLARLVRSYNVNIVNEWNGNLYTFSGWDTVSFSSELYRFDIGDTKYSRPVFVADFAERFFPTDEYMFYVKKESLNIHRASIDGMGDIVLFDVVCYAMVVEDDTVYFADSEGNLFSADKDGNELKSLYSGERIYNIFPDGDFLYFCDSSVIYRYSFRDGGIQQIGDSRDVYMFLIFDEKTAHDKNGNATGYNYDASGNIMETAGRQSIKDLIAHNMTSITQGSAKRYEQQSQVFNLNYSRCVVEKTGSWEISRYPSSKLYAYSN